jgi:hypothetical protein
MIMTKLLVNAPTGEQQIITVGEGGGYFDINRVLWDERIDGGLPDITLGGMVRVDNNLILDETLLAKSVKAIDNMKAEEVRSQRTALLRTTDWTGLSDVTMSAAWAAYRQELRDIPEQEGFPNTVVWPEEP